MARDFFGRQDTSVDKSEVPAKKERRQYMRCLDCRRTFSVEFFKQDTADCPTCKGCNVEPR